MRTVSLAFMNARADIAPRHSVSAFRSDSVEYFVVTSIDSNASGIRHDRTAGDVYDGEMGCWVDPSITRMMQTGVEHVRTPQHLPTADRECTYMSSCQSQEF